jgi:ABC-type spermidine/putrescine transport system permease subunit II
MISECWYHIFFRVVLPQLRLAILGGGLCSPCICFRNAGFTQWYGSTHSPT